MRTMFAVSALVVCVVLAPASSAQDLAIQKFGDPDCAGGGGALSPTPLSHPQNCFFETTLYFIQVTNNGPGDALNVQIHDVIPSSVTFDRVLFVLPHDPGFEGTCSTPPSGGTGPLTCTWPVIQPGESASVAFTVNISPGTYPIGQPLVNTATVTSSTTDPVSTNNSATATLVVHFRDLGAPTLHWTGMIALAAALIASALFAMRRL